MYSNLEDRSDEGKERCPDKFFSSVLQNVVTETFTLGDSAVSVGPFGV